MVNGMVWHGGCCLPAKTDEDGRARERSVSVHVSITQGFHITICLSPNRYTFHSFPSTEFSPLFLRVSLVSLAHRRNFQHLSIFGIENVFTSWCCWCWCCRLLCVRWVHGSMLFFSFLLVLLLLLFHCFFFFVFTLSLDGIFVIDNR